MLERTSLALSGTRLERARGRVGITCVTRAGQTVLDDLAQEGCGRALFPARMPSDPLEAVLVNTAGGVTGGDQMKTRVVVRREARAIVTTQACEKVYRSDGTPASVSTRMSVQDHAHLFWLPQETILFEGSNLKRSLLVDVAASATFLACEALLLGRAAMGETLNSARLRDSWRIRREGRLIFAEETRAEGTWGLLRERAAALGRDAEAVATLVMVAPDVHALLPPLRALLDAQNADAGVSAFDGLLTMRCTASSGLALRALLVPVLQLCMGAHLPRVWQT